MLLGTPVYIEKSKLEIHTLGTSTLNIYKIQLIIGGNTTQIILIILSPYGKYLIVHSSHKASDRMLFAYDAISSIIQNNDTLGKLKIYDTVSSENNFLANWQKALILPKTHPILSIKLSQMRLKLTAISNVPQAQSTLTYYAYK